MRGKKIWVWILFATLGFGGGFFWGSIQTKKNESITMAAPKEEVKQSASILTETRPVLTPSPIVTPEKKEFLLMLSGESIHLYELLENGGTTLLQETPVDTGQLRKEDYADLCRGIVLHNLEEAKTLCEDFAS